MTGKRQGGGEWGRGLTRRQFLAAGAASGVGVLAASCGSGPASTVAKSTAVPPAGSDLGAVEHVIFLMMENRSFDHYYGTYPGARGFDDHPAGDLGPFSQACPSNTSASPVGRLLPFRLDTVSTDLADCTFDLTHNWKPQHLCRNEGKMDSFARVHTESEYEGPSQGTLTMGYYTRADLPYYYALADAFTLCDGYHCSVMGPTHPNRLMQMSGTLDPAGKAGGPVVVTNGKPSAIFSVHWDTMPEVLEDAGVSWKYYNPGGSLYSIETMGKIGLTTDSVLPYFSQYSNPASALYKKAFLQTFPGDFAADVRAGTLPKVSWISTPVGYDEHPPAPSFLGEWFTDQVLRTLVSNPDVWSKTVLFHMYDENDGFFDHVDPPVAPPGTEGEYLSVRPAPFRGPGDRRSDRARLSGTAARAVAVQPRWRHLLADLRSHLPVALHRGALRGHGAEPLVVASIDGGRPHGHAADGPADHDPAGASTDPQRPCLPGGQGMQGDGSPRGRHGPASLSGAHQPGHADPGEGLGHDGLTTGPVT